jgi:hypothetical protein
MDITYASTMINERLIQHGKTPEENMIVLLKTLMCTCRYPQDTNAQQKLCRDSLIPILIGMLANRARYIDVKKPLLEILEVDEKIHGQTHRNPQQYTTQHVVYQARTPAEAVQRDPHHSIAHRQHLPVYAQNRNAYPSQQANVVPVAPTLLPTVRRRPQEPGMERSVEKNIQCCICMYNPATFAILPCGHLCFCATCPEGYRKSKINSRQPYDCPICRGVIERLTRVPDAQIELLSEDKEAQIEVEERGRKVIHRICTGTQLSGRHLELEGDTHLGLEELLCRLREIGTTTRIQE